MFKSFTTQLSHRDNIKTKQKVQQQQNTLKKTMLNVPFLFLLLND